MAEIVIWTHNHTEYLSLAHAPMYRRIWQHTGRNQWRVHVSAALRHGTTWHLKTPVEP